MQLNPCSSSFRFRIICSLTHGPCLDNKPQKNNHQRTHEYGIGPISLLRPSSISLSLACLSVQETQQCQAPLSSEYCCAPREITSTTTNIPTRIDSTMVRTFRFACVRSVPQRTMEPGVINHTLTPVFFLLKSSQQDRRIRICFGRQYGFPATVDSVTGSKFYLAD